PLLSPPSLSFLTIPPPPRSTLFPYTTLFRSSRRVAEFYEAEGRLATEHALLDDNGDGLGTPADWFRSVRAVKKVADGASADGLRSEEHTSELQSLTNLVCRLLLEKKKKYSMT